MISILDKIKPGTVKWKIVGKKANNLKNIFYQLFGKWRQLIY